MSCEKPLLVINKKSEPKEDSVSYYIKQSQKKELKFIQKKELLEKAYQFAKKQPSDSLQNIYLAKIAIETEYLNINDLFLAVNSESLAFAKKLNDGLKIGDAHWNYGNYYTDVETVDSAYYHYHKAFESFEQVKHNYYAAKMLYNMAFIQGRLKDYTGSEITIFEAISRFEKVERYDRLYECYNYLGLIYLELEEFDRSIFYLNKAIEYLKKNDKKGIFKEWTLSNLGLAYQKQKAYDKAIENFENALAHKNLKEIDANFYSRLIDNIAYTKFLKGDTANIVVQFNKALFIRDSLKNSSGIVISKRHLSELYAYKLDTTTAIKLANDAFGLADQVENNRDKLETLHLLSKVDKKNASKYLEEYVHLNDSLQIEERKIRNKFTRIRFETDEYIEETEKLSQQNIFIIIGSVFLIFLVSFAYIMRAQRARNKELIFEREQQKANEEIFTLMLKQQAKLKEGRLKERHRISADLHDGVLGRIFGTRLGLGFLNIKGDEPTIEKHKSYIDELQNIEKEIRAISHELKNEILSSKEDFSKIIDDLIEQKSKIGDFKYNFECDKKIDWDKVDDKVKINFYRIIQEALQNIIKYANADFVTITIEIKNKNINLVVKDNGNGFNTKDKRKGIGLKNMHSRATNLGGKFKITSNLNKGTSVFVNCPI
ncbi:ATP-binding protein [Lutibacter aestuarii]|uniref:histidine kinase n=1 Tax=Lutibacter aestuarii TaxID=861111 RepID=A0ABW2Z4V1_9FLAO